MTMRRTMVLLVVGLTPALLRHAPALSRLAGRGGMRPLRTILPALTCPVQATFATGTLPREHGIVGNGWYFRDLAEVWLWRQSDHLIAGDRLWDEARRRDAGFTCAKLFWWYNMYSTADIAVTPRPIYTADGRKIPDLHTAPAGLRDDLQGKLGRFPLFQFWGPMAGAASSRWIADCALDVFTRHASTLTLVYLPHLDYDLQRYGPDDPRAGAAVALVDGLCEELIAAADRAGAAVVALSEYGITPVGGAVALNQVLRRAGLVAVREEQGTELLDAGASEAFAVADHQVAHVYVRRPQRVAEVKALLEAVPGVERVLDAAGRRACGLDHARAGELVAISRADRWFSYYYWLDQDRAPDFARTVEIHRKPGYDPAELFLDPRLSWPKLRIAWRLAKKAAGFRTLMDVIPLDAGLVKGSHGRPTDDPLAGPLVISSEPALLADAVVPAEAVRRLILDHVFAPTAVGAG